MYAFKVAKSYARHACILGLSGPPLPVPGSTSPLIYHFSMSVSGLLFSYDMTHNEALATGIRIVEV